MRRNQRCIKTNYKPKLYYALEELTELLEMINSNNDNDWWTAVRRNWKRGGIK
ncbi:MAG: hypothetical protein ACTS6P_00305 [Candidatus Hodgkinia cicadicola]